MAEPHWTWSRALRPDEQVLFIPGIARWQDDARLAVDVEAWVFEHEPRRGLRTLFARYLGLDLDAMDAAERARFEQRCALFLTDSERGKVIDVAFDAPLDAPDGRLTLPATDPAGRSSARAVIAADALPAGARALHFHALRSPDDPSRFAGHAIVVPAQGLSVISDIDDTIKRTQVHDRRELLLNTFARPFHATPGLAAHYQRLAADPALCFHYLSTSPIQLAPALLDFLREAGFPAGSLHLRESTHWRTLLPRAGDTEAHKRGVIERLLADLPQRRFVLVGDSGEADPEIYAAVARAHPQRIVALVIRDLNGEGRAAPRWARAFEDLPQDLWHLLAPDGDDWPL